MRRRARRSRRGRAGRAKGWLVISIGVALIVAIAAIGGYLKFGERSTNRETGCPVDQYDSITAVLVDLTDSISPVQAAALRNALLKIRDEIPKLGRLEIYPLRPLVTSTLEPLFAGCSPGSGHEVDSSIYGNPELADRLWRIKFADEIDVVIKSLRTVEPQNTSPLFEGIQSVAVTAFGDPLSATAQSKRLIIISDMIHHTSQLSLYSGAPDFGALKKTPYYPTIKPQLHDADTEIFLIVRDTKHNVQRPPLFKFWVEYIDAGDGYLSHWEPLQ